MTDTCYFHMKPQPCPVCAGAIVTAAVIPPGEPAGTEPLTAAEDDFVPPFLKRNPDGSFAVPRPEGLPPVPTGRPVMEPAIDPVAEREKERERERANYERELAASIKKRASLVKAGFVKTTSEHSEGEYTDGKTWDTRKARWI